MPELTSLPSSALSPQQRASRTNKLHSETSQQLSTLDIERVCRILVRFALTTEEIRHEQTTSFSTQEQ